MENIEKGFTEEGVRRNKVIFKKEQLKPVLVGRALSRRNLLKRFEQPPPQPRKELKKGVHELSIQDLYPPVILKKIPPRCAFIPNKEVLRTILQVVAVNRLDTVEQMLERFGF